MHIFYDLLKESQGVKSGSGAAQNIFKGRQCPSPLKNMLDQSIKNMKNKRIKTKTENLINSFFIQIHHTTSCQVMIKGGEKIWQ